jgi:hypothetical protein
MQMVLQSQKAKKITAGIITVATGQTVGEAQVLKEAIISLNRNNNQPHFLK